MRHFLISSIVSVFSILILSGQEQVIDYCSLEVKITHDVSLISSSIVSKLTPSNDTINFCLLSNLLDHKTDLEVSNEIIDTLIEYTEERYSQARFDNSIVYANYGIALAKMNKDTARILTLSMYNIRSYDRLGQFFQAHKTIIDSKELAQKSTNHQAYASLLLREGFSFWKVYHRPRALEIADDYYVYFKKHNLPSNELYSYHGLKATVYRALGKYEKSRIHGDSAIYHAFLLEDEKAKGIALSNRAIQYPDASIEEMEYRKGLLRKALAINHQMDDKQQLASNYGALSTLYLKNKEYNESLKYSKISMEIATQINDKSEIFYTHMRLANVYIAQNNYKDALRHKKKELEHYKTLFGSEDLNKIFNKSIELKAEKEQENLRKIEFQKEKNKIQARKEQNLLLVILIVSIIILGFLSYLIIRNWMKSKIENAILKEEINNQINALETKTLRSQMNPHFLFNSLNSIKSYIAKREPRQATKYLNKFSQLIRQILNISKEEWISLDDELKTLKLYIELEQLRMSNAFKFIIKVDEGINNKDIKVPPLIFQPFVENSIWHGLSNKKGDKTLSIIIHKNKEKTIATIEDNGIGREASALIKKQSNSRHVSHGMRITRDRLRLSDKNFRDNFKISTIDLIDSNNSATGTKIIIEIPSKLK